MKTIRTLALLPLLLAACDDGGSDPTDAAPDPAADGGLDMAPTTDAAPVDQAVPDAAPDLGPPPPAPFAADALIGTWTSVECEPSMGEFVTRQLAFTDTEWSVTGTVFDNRDCTGEMFTFELGGTYEITGGSRLGDDIAEATFVPLRSVWTVHQDIFAMAFTVNACGSDAWEIGVPQDISATGCIGFAYPLDTCADGELDLLRIDGDLLYTGDRSVDLCRMRAPGLVDGGAQRLPDAVVIDVPGFYPEGVALDPDRAVYLGAFTTGEIRKAAFGSASAETLVQPGALGGAALGLKVYDGRLWACATDLGAPENSALVLLDPDTGEEQARLPLPGGGICNDIAFAEDGTAYITESSANGVLRLPPGGDALEPWFVGDMLPPVGGMGFGFNGLVIDVDGSVLVGRIDDGTLTRIPVLEDGGAGEAVIEAVEPAEVAFGIDGMARWREGYYAIRDLAVVRLRPGDPWTTEVIADGDDFPTTIAIDRSGNVWTAESKFGLLFDGDDATDAEPPFRAVRHPLY